MSAIVVGNGLGAALFAGMVTGALAVQFLHVAAILFVASAAALVIGSLLASRRRDYAIADGAMVGHESLRIMLASLPRPIFWGAVALLATTGVIVLGFSS